MSTVSSTTLHSNKQFKTGAWASPQRADVYDQTTSSKSDLTHFVTTEFLERLVQRIAPGAKVLDLGCGTGVLTKALAARGYDTTGLDISRAMLEKIHPESPSDRITLWEGDVYALPFPDASFDGIVTRWVIPHFRDWPLIVKEAARVLKPGGTLVFDHCNRANYDLATRHGAFDYEKFGYDNRTHGSTGAFYASASVHELQTAADIAGLEMLSVEPQSFFRQNALVASAVGGDGFEVYRQAMDRFYQDAGARMFIEWFERNVTPGLPLDVANGATVVCRKPNIS
jgi:ubiquinone/menaquinone biosynthesis C-methylase UbiE